MQEKLTGIMQKTSACFLRKSGVVSSYKNICKNLQDNKKNKKEPLKEKQKFFRGSFLFLVKSNKNEGRNSVNIEKMMSKGHFLKCKHLRKSENVIKLQ